MLSALAWKEWREQRPILLAGLSLGLLMPVFLIAGASTLARGLDLDDVARVLPGFYAVLLWPLFAAAAGAATVASEKGEGTLPFLLSRPISRGRIWSMKVALGGLVTIAMIAGSYLFAAAFRLFVPSPWGRSWDALVPSAMGVEVALSSATLLFAAAAFYSTLFSRPMTAAAAAVATSLALTAGLQLLWSTLDVLPRFEPGWLALQILLASALLLAGSRWLFVRGELLRGGGYRRNALRIAAIALVLFAIGTIPLIQAGLRLTPATAVFRDPILAPGGEAVIVWVTDPMGGSSQIWSIPADGAGFTRLTGRLARSPELSPDGRWIAYVSQRGPLGLRARNAELRIIGSDGSGDRLLLGGLDGQASTSFFREDVPKAFSPRGDRLALQHRGRIAVVPVDGGETRWLEEADQLEEIRLIGWTPDGSEVIVHASTAERERHGLFALDAQNGPAREVMWGEAVPWPGSRRAAPERRIVLTRMAEPGEDGDARYESQVVDLENGRNWTLPRGHCAARTDIASDQIHIAYTGCDDRSGSAELRLRDLESGEESVLGTADSIPASLALSPANDHLLVVMPRGSDTGSFVLDRDGTRHALDPGTIPLGWSGRDRLLLLEAHAAGPPRILRADWKGEDVRVIYP